MTTPEAARQGPRPLPLFLGAQTLLWLSSCAGFPSLKDGSTRWKEAAPPPRRERGKADQAALAAAVEREARDRLAGFMEGVIAYRRHPARRTLKDPEPLWRAGTTRLRPHGDGTGCPVLVVPSLVNRASILDLQEGASFLRRMANAGLDPYLLDWDAPGAEERAYGLTDYVAQRLEPALDAVAARNPRPCVVLGYCMGGLLALALAARRRDLAGFVAMATPYDFGAPMAEHASQLEVAAPALTALIDTLGVLPVDALQAMFGGLDPFAITAKFRRFRALPPDSREAEAFVLLEDWLNDGVDLAGPVARECLFGWYGANTPASGTWTIGGQPVLAAEIAVPALVVIPSRDRIVPPDSARALAVALPRAAASEVDLGHIGMVTARAAGEKVQDPIIRWIERAGDAASR